MAPLDAYYASDALRTQWDVRTAVSLNIGTTITACLCFFAPQAPAGARPDVCSQLVAALAQCDSDSDSTACRLEQQQEAEEHRADVA